MFQNVKRFLSQNKAHTKISKGLKFSRSTSYTFNLFFLLIFLPSFLVNLRIALYQEGLIDRYQLAITGLMELLWLRWITWKTDTTFCMGMTFLV